MTRPGREPVSGAGAQPERPRSLGRQLAIIGFVGFPLIVLILGALALPALVSYSLLTRGVAESHHSWLVLGGLTGLLWLAMLWGTARKILRPTPSPKPLS